MGCLNFAGPQLSAANAYSMVQHHARGRLSTCCQDECVLHDHRALIGALFDLRDDDYQKPASLLINSLNLVLLVLSFSRSSKRSGYQRLAQILRLIGC